MAKYKRKTIGGAPALAIKLLVVICVIGFAAALLSGCTASTPPEGPVVNSEDDPNFSDGDESIYSEGPTYVEVPSNGRRADVFDFRYTTEQGTEATCIVYDRSGGKTTNREGGAGIWCFEESPDGGIIAPLPRPQR